MKKTNFNSLTLNKKSIAGFNSLKEIQNPNEINGGYAEGNASSTITWDDIIIL
jgi:hypothetical protein